MTIPQLREALDAIGATSIDGRAHMLNIRRSTCHFIFSTKGKSRGITARILLQMLRSPHLPANARTIVVNYARSKASNYRIERHRKKFVDKLNGDIQAANDN